MGKKTEPKKMRVLVFCPEYTGYLDEMPEELKAAREARKEARLQKK